MLRNPRRNFVCLLAVLASLLIGAVAVGDLATTARYGSYLAIDSLLANDKPVSAQVIADYAQRLSKSPQTCRTDILNSAVDIAMRNVEQETTSLDRTAWIASLRSLEPLLRDSLACMPTNGLLWARLAVVRWLLGGTAEEQASLLTMSQAYAPSELRVIRSRLVQWRRVSPKVLELAERWLRSDVRTILNYAEVSAAKRLLADVPPLVKPFVAEEALVLPQERRTAFVQAGIPLD